MIKLKLNRVSLETLCYFSTSTCNHLEKEIEKFIFHKKSLELIQLKVQLAEMKSFKRKLEILCIKKTGIADTKKFYLTLSPIQSLMILLYTKTYKETNFNECAQFIMNEQKDIIYKELLTQ